MNSNSGKIAVAMSGGVDSSVTVALLADKYGKENVFGITMRLFCYGDEKVGPKSCCSLSAINDAKGVCRKLKIKHYVLNFEKEFEKEVINNFVSEYLKGRTPNPCVRCNTIVKFEYLYKKAESLGADFIATGHYAQIKKRGNRYLLLKGRDEEKDQSYFLYGATQKQLAHSLFPLGNMKKTEVRKLAKEYSLKTAEKVESQEICFVADNNYRGFITKKTTKKINEGDIVDNDGKVLGKHKGLPFYTIGQRKGIGIARKKPYYVIGFNIKKNQLVVGDEKDLYREEFQVTEANWISGKAPNNEFKADVMIRYNMKPQRATIKANNKNTLYITFDKPQKSVTPGQSAVFYSKDEVIGGGIIISV